jgi:hypothetical protein
MNDQMSINSEAIIFNKNYGGERIARDNKFLIRKGKKNEFMM